MDNISISITKSDSLSELQVFNCEGLLWDIPSNL